MASIRSSISPPRETALAEVALRAAGDDRAEELAVREIKGKRVTDAGRFEVDMVAGERLSLHVELEAEFAGAVQVLARRAQGSAGGAKSLNNAIVVEDITINGGGEGGLFRQALAIAISQDSQLDWEWPGRDAAEREIANYYSGPLGWQKRPTDEELMNELMELRLTQAIGRVLRDADEGTIYVQGCHLWKDHTKIAG